MDHSDENKDTPIPRKLSYISSISEDQSNGASKFGAMTMDILKSTPINNTPALVDAEPIPLFSIAKIYKNLFLLALAFVLMFTAYNGMATLQSSLNTKNNVGVNSLIVTYSFLIVNIHAHR
jgi:hypothetical protein